MYATTGATMWPEPGSRARVCTTDGLWVSDCACGRVQQMLLVMQELSFAKSTFSLHTLACSQPIRALVPPYHASPRRSDRAAATVAGSGKLRLPT